MSAFHLDTDQLAKLAAWRETHDRTCRFTRNSGAIGGRLTFSFTPTSLFTRVDVECACGGEVDLTDYDGV